MGNLHSVANQTSGFKQHSDSDCDRGRGTIASSSMIPLAPVAACIRLFLDNVARLMETEHKQLQLPLMLTFAMISPSAPSPLVRVSCFEYDY